MWFTGVMMMIINDYNSNCVSQGSPHIWRERGRRERERVGREGGRSRLRARAREREREREREGETDFQEFGHMIVEAW